MLQRALDIFATFARGIPWSAEPFDDLGRTYDLAEVGFRPKRSCVRSSIVWVAATSS